MAQNIKVTPDAPTLVAEIVTWLQDRLQQSIDQRGHANLVLAGGSTPKAIYAALVSAQLPWDKLHVFWGDERYVSPSDPESNELMARQSWLDLVPIPPANLHPWPTQAGSPEICADQYEKELLAQFNLTTGELPQFDLILLGMGDDGHTASLFPHTPALQVSDRLTAVGNKLGQPRLTLTVPLINQAHVVAFIITGATKQQALQQVFAKDSDAQAYPAKLIQPIGELWWWDGCSSRRRTILIGFTCLLILSQKL